MTLQGPVMGFRARWRMEREVEEEEGGEGGMGRGSVIGDR